MNTLPRPLRVLTLLALAALAPSQAATMTVSTAGFTGDAAKNRDKE